MILDPFERLGLHDMKISERSGQLSSEHCL